VGTCVIVDFCGRQASSRDDTDGPIFHEANDCLLIVVGDKDCIPALEMGIRFLREGSKGVIYSHSKYAYGNLTRVSGDYELPENSNVIYHAHVKKIVKPTEVEIATSRKKIANDCYKNEWSNGHGSSRPLYLYKKAAEAMNNVLVDSPGDEEARCILVDCLNNMAAVHLRAKEYGKAKEAATRVLEQDPDNVKALCRAARSAMLDQAGSYEESEAAISAAESLKPDDVDVIKVRSELTRRKREYKNKSKAAFSKLGSSEKKPKKDVPGKNNDSVGKTATSNSNNNEKTESSGDPSNTSRPPELRSWSEVLRPMILQMAISFIALFVFQYMAKQKDIESIKEHVHKDMNSDTEF